MLFRSPHFHIPLQNGSDRILGLMKRRYRRDIFAERVNRIREIIPLAGIGADVITGFPGETEEDFEETYSFLNGLYVSYLHVFPFSARPGTEADKMPAKVSPEEKNRRSKILIALSQKKAQRFREMNRGKTAEVLFEHVRSKGLIYGFTGNYIRVEYPWEAKLAGSIRAVRLHDISSSGNMTIELNNDNERFKDHSE